MLREDMLLRVFPILRAILAPPLREIPPPPNEPPLPAFAGREIPKIAAVAAVAIRIRFIDRRISTPAFIRFK
jgi:hypothetical protein